MDLVVSETNKGKKALLYEGFTYRIDFVLKSEGISWRCTKKGCKAKLCHYFCPKNKKLFWCGLTIKAINMKLNTLVESVDPKLLTREDNSIQHFI